MKLSKEHKYLVNGRRGQYELTTADGKSECFFMDDTNKYEYFKAPKVEGATTSVVRVGVANNFYCTKAEWDQLDAFAAKNPQRLFFVNCNIKTPSLITINCHPYKAVITINPDLYVLPELILKLSEIDPEKITFVRLKWVPSWQAHEVLLEDLVEDGLTVGITPQRFKTKAHINKYADPYFYKLDHTWFRLAGEAKKNLEDLVDSKRFKGKAFICDRLGHGCPSCGHCAREALGEDVPVHSLNLSSSGVCDYHCPDCFAKFNAIRAHGRVFFDKIHMNDKQQGKTIHD